MLPDESSRTLDSLPPRPPTPPRDSQLHSASRPSLFNRLFSKSPGAQTPPNLSPPGSTAGAESSPSERATRRVAWSASTDYRDHDELSKNPRGINPKLRLIPSSIDRPLPPKSILKQNNGDAVNRLIDFHIPPHEHSPETFATMLESVTKQLAGDDRLSRIDAYMSLSGVLKATDSIPDEEALRNKMGLLAQFIRRDMEARQADGEFDKVLVNNALTLLASLLWKKEQFPQDFAIFVLEHTITSFENRTVPKDVAKHLMFIIGQQNFSPKIVTLHRATRLLNATYMIQESYKGKSIELGRLSIYKKLLRQAKPVMLANIAWLKHAFDDMLNPDKHVRLPVIDFGIEAALNLGNEKHGSRAFTELFDSDYDENTTYADYYHTRLLRMLQARGDNATLEKTAVPQIWSILILFLRYKPSQLDKWAHWTNYLHILQKCFNSSDQEVKAQANIAWNRLVFALQPDATEEKRKLNRQLLQPFLGQLHVKRKHVGKASKEMFQITVSSACNLLYYALRPGASHASLDLLWDLYVPPLIQQLSDTDSSEAEQKAGAATCEGSNQAIAILHALLNPTPRAKQPWRIDRAMSDEHMHFDELSPIDPKWVRPNSQRLLAVLQPLLERRFMDLSTEESRLKDLWKGFLLSIAAAGSKEIITSHETMQCIAQIYTMAHTLWQQRPCHDIITQEGQSTAFLDGFVYLLTEMVKVLGVLPFGEKRLSIEDTNPFAVIATPSTSSRKAPKAAKTAVQCLIALLVGPGVDIESDFALKGALRRLLSPFHQFRVKNRTDLDFCKELFETLPSPQAETHVPVPTKKRRSSQQVEREPEPERELVETTPTVQIVVKSPRNKRRKQEEKRLQPQVVEDSQQDHQGEVEHEGTTVPPLSQVAEKPEKSDSSSTPRTAKSATGSQSSNVESDGTTTGKKARKRGKRGLSAADRSVVESSQQAEEEERAARLREQQLSDEAMPDADADADADAEPRSRPGEAEDETIPIISSHLEVEETGGTTNLSQHIETVASQSSVPPTPSVRTLEQEQQPFTSSPPPHLSQEEQRVLDEVRESQRKKSRAPSAPPSQLGKAVQQELLENAGTVESEAAVAEAAEAEREDSSSENHSDEDLESSSSSQTPHLLQQVSQSLSQHFETAAKQPSIQPTSTPPVQIQEQQPKSSTPIATSSIPPEQKDELTYENISAVFQHGIAMLNRCERGIRRHHVAKMEEMVFDIKAAMYNAEKRSREGLSEEERMAEFGRM